MARADLTVSGPVSAPVATASGQSATALSLLNVLRSGDHIVMASQIYGGTTNLLVIQLTYPPAVPVS